IERSGGRGSGLAHSWACGLTLQARLGIGTTALVVTALAARHDRVSRGEARAFCAVNGLPDALQVPAWAIMQLGTLGAVPAAAGAAWRADRPELAGPLLARRPPTRAPGPWPSG